MPKRPADISNAPQRIRIVSGSLRGSKIDVVDVPGLRPTPDRVRETLFNWLAPVIEAISRGASSCPFVERDPRAAATLTVTLARLKVENADVTTRDAMAFLNDPQGPFDLVFLDPPFGNAAWTEISAKLESSSALVDGAWIYLESPGDAAPAVPIDWRLHREARSGNVRHVLYQRLGCPE